MIRAMIFDLDGTLVQTERLKALSYARAAVELCPDHLTEAEVIEDSPAGVHAALAAGMDVLAVSTPFTKECLHTSVDLSPGQLVDDPATLPAVVARLVAQHR